jgi:DNA (cytosine-5)-methyltransferase 1
VPTLNVFDNASETRATVLIVSIDFYNASIDERNFHTLRSGGANEGKPGVLIIDGTRVNDVRVYEDGIVPTVISRYGTGGGNVPMIQKEKEQTVRRLTPVECERLQGFPDDWTSGQADSNRYKQMGNAVAVPVVEWIVGRLVAQLND